MEETKEGSNKENKNISNSKRVCEILGDVSNLLSSIEAHDDFGVKKMKIDDEVIFIESW